MARMGMRKPFNKTTGRDYKEEYARYQGTSAQKKNRALRNNVRREALREGKAHKGDGMDVDHIRPLRDGGSNSKSNLRVISKSRNRGFPRDSKNNPKGSA